jgi:inhibitor of cysteine peptidase
LIRNSQKRGNRMKAKAIITVTTMVLAIFLPACSSGPRQTALEVSCDEFTNQKNVTKQVEVGAGDTLTVTLCSNPSTGFSWSESAQVSDQTIVQQTDHKYVAPEAEAGTTPVVGAAGTEVWTFEALKKGTSTIYVEYSRPWEGGEKGEWTFHLTVVVK